MQIDQNQLISIIENAVVSVDVEKIKRGESFKDSGIDSLEVMNVFLGVEEAFSIKIPDEDIDSLTTLDAVFKYLQKI